MIKKILILSLFSFSIFATDFTEIDEVDQEIILLEQEVTSLLNLCTVQNEQHRLYKMFRKEQMEYRLEKYKTGWTERKYIQELEYIKKQMSRCV